MITIDEYLDKVCKDTEAANAAVEDAGKKYCKGFKKGKDGYCKNYTGAKPFNMSCYSQCKKRK